MQFNLIDPPGEVCLICLYGCDQRTIFYIKKEGTEGPVLEVCINCWYEDMSKKDYTILGTLFWREHGG